MTIYHAKSVVISRKPTGKCMGAKNVEKGSWSAYIGLFDDNNPHLKAKAPIDVLEIKDIDKVRVNELRNVSYYLEGNDVVINNLIELEVDVKERIVTLTGKQEI